VEKAAALNKLKKQIELAGNVHRESASFRQWHRNTELAIEHIFAADTRHTKDFGAISYTPGAWNLSDPEPAFQRAFSNGIRSAQAVLTSMVDEIEEYWPEAGPIEAMPLGPISRIERICRRFHLTARQLRSRHSKRPTLDVEDEYDVQNLMHALLRIDFNDIRAEEWCPSYAGKNARMSVSRDQLKFRW
jgi:hypothetical protein